MAAHVKNVDWDGVKVLVGQKIPALREALREMIAQCDTHTICADVHPPGAYLPRAFALVQCWIPHTDKDAPPDRRVSNDGPPSRLEFLTDDELGQIAALVAEAVASVGELQVFGAKANKVYHGDFDRRGFVWFKVGPETMPTKETRTTKSLFRIVHHETHEKHENGRQRSWAD